MITRESLWRRIGSPDAWALPWAMAAACALPWLLPETWNGHVPGWVQVLAWTLVLASAPLLRTRWTVVPLALALVWGTASHLAWKARWESALPQGMRRVQGVVCEPWKASGLRREGRLKLEAPPDLDGLEVPILLPLDGDAAPPPGTRLRLQAELRATDAAPAFLPERPLWRSRSDGAPRRIHLASALEMEPLGPAEPSLPMAWKTWVRQRFDALPLPPGSGRDIWGALALGLPVVHEEALTPFTESGTLHLLVVSGLQVTLVVAAIEVLARRLLRRRPRLAAAAAALAGIAYAFAVGFSAPVWRGLLMGLAWIVGRSEGWRLPPSLTLHGALLIWLLGHPAAGCEPGFLLAWWALLGLLWGTEPLAGLMSPLLGRGAVGAARLVAPWLSTLPLVALFFGGVPVWGVVANLVVLPLVTALTPLCLFLTLVPVPGLTEGLAFLLEWTGTSLLPRFGGLRPLCTASIWPWVLLALAWLALAHGSALLRRTRGLLVATLGLAFLLIYSRGTGARPRSLEFEAIDVGQGDALLLRVPGAEATLVDTGPSPWSARRIVKVLSRRGVKEAVHLVVTHPHSDHAGGWGTLQRLWPMASTLLPASRDDTAAWAPFRPAEVNLATVRRGDGWRRGQARFTVLWPLGRLNLEALGDANMVSAVLRVDWEDRQLWLMGDALAIQERDLLGLANPGPYPGFRLLKLGHHGSRSSSDPAWISALSPDLSLATAGRRNRFGHPHAETMATFAAAGLSAPVHVGQRRGIRVLAVTGGWSLESGDGGREHLRKAAGPGTADPR